MQNLIDDIIVWQRSAFKEVDHIGATRHLAEEIVEYLAAKSPATLKYEVTRLCEIMQAKMEKELAEDKERQVDDEVADLQFMVIQLADLDGLRLPEITAKKMEKNQIRRWQIDENGVAQHVQIVED